MLRIEYCDCEKDTSRHRWSKEKQILAKDHSDSFLNDIWGLPLKGQDMNMEQEEDGEAVGLPVRHLCFIPEDEQTGGPGSQKGLTQSASGY